ncbi:MAG TPA: hypothetical protein VFN97_18470 [Actinospica sp.]|nr:hypothetical protein [Actinospica sp.]
MDAGLVGALSDTAATGLILGGGALGSGLLVLGLTVLAVRRGAREERRRRAAARARARRTVLRTAAAADSGPHDHYPQQPYSAAEPTSHQPYSRPYSLPRQDSPAKTNGHLDAHEGAE